MTEAVEKLRWPRASKNQTKQQISEEKEGGEILFPQRLKKTRRHVTARGHVTACETELAGTRFLREPPPLQPPLPRRFLRHHETALRGKTRGKKEGKPRARAATAGQWCFGS